MITKGRRKSTNVVDKRLAGRGASFGTPDFRTKSVDEIVLKKPLKHSNPGPVPPVPMPEVMKDTDKRNTSLKRVMDSAKAVVKPIKKPKASAKDLMSMRMAPVRVTGNGKRATTKRK